MNTGVKRVNVSLEPTTRPRGIDKNDRSYRAVIQRLFTKKKQKKQDIIIGTWNVRTLHQWGQHENIKEEKNRVTVNILGVCEFRRASNGNFVRNAQKVKHSDGEKMKEVLD